MSFKRLDIEDVVLSSELVTFPTWYTQAEGDTSMLRSEDVVKGPEQGPSVDFFTDYYSIYSGSDNDGSEGTSSAEPTYNPDYSKPLFSVAYAQKPEEGWTPSTRSMEENASQIVYGQYRSLVLGDEYSDFMFGSTVVGADDNVAEIRGCEKFVALSVERSRFREKLDPDTCQITFRVGESQSLVLRPDISANRRYLDAGRVYDLAEAVEDESGNIRYVYPELTESGSRVSYGYFLPDIGVILFNVDDGYPGTWVNPLATRAVDGKDLVQEFVEQKLQSIYMRSQETVTSNFVFIRARNGEFNYSTNPSNIVGSAGNIRHNVMINQPQSFITTVGLYNDANELLAVAKLSRPLVKDFTKEALIRIKLDY